MDIIGMAFHLTAAVARYSQRARRFFYEVMLSDLTCRQCRGRLVMVGQSRCRCTSCGYVFDPTVSFQRCSACGGVPVLRVRRYQCQQCGVDVPSRFVFEGLVFDVEYFRRKMAESRQRKRAQRERIQHMVAENRSLSLEAPPTDLEEIPGLMEALNSLTAGAESRLLRPLQQGFDLRRYQRHLQAHIGLIEVCFNDLPPLEKNTRKDRIWRFVALIFMAHTGLIEIRQDGQTIMVSQSEAD